MKWFLVYRNLNIGGAETLIIRLSKKLNEYNYLGGIVAKSISDFTREELYTNNLYDDVIEFDKFGEEFCSINVDDIVMTFSFEDFARINKKMKATRCKVFLYVINSSQISFFSKQPFKLIDRILNYRTMRKYIRNGNVFVMDKASQNSIIHAYGLEINCDICLLPLDVFTIDSLSLEERESRNTIKVLTVARADFPFKGYVKGLLSAVKELERECKIELTIITSGDEVERINQWIMLYDVSSITKVLLDVAYEDLPNYYKKSHVYVGMGTTVIEASLYGVPALAVKAYTYECNTKGFFEHDPYSVGDKKLVGSDIKPYIKKIYEMRDEEYALCCLNSNRIAYEKYGIDRFIDFITNRNINSLSLHNWKFYNIEVAVRNIREKNYF